MLIFAIETSCDETAAAVVQDGTNVLSNVISSSVANFQGAGGVIPEEAARKQVECILPVIDKAMNDAEVTKEDIDALAVTKGPGLLVSLLVGTTTARTLASLWKKPLIGVHHTLGHLSSAWLEVKDEPEFPILTLSASGGHTDLWLLESHTKGKLLGRTRDDAAGEAFDKGAKLLGLTYPGGPSISKEAEKGNSKYYEFPLPLHDDDSLDFSFSGLKTALKYLLREIGIRNSEIGNRDNKDDLSRTPNSGFRIPNICASYQHAICKHLVDRINKAIESNPEVQAVHLVGGVSANIHLRQLATSACKPLPVHTPKLISYCTDNAAMVGAAAFFLYKEKGKDTFKEFEANASLPLLKGLTT